MAERLLIVDDEESLCESLRRVFLREGYEVDCVDCSESALKNIEEKSYDLVISDIIMPGINGIELLRKCKQKNPDLIVVIITAYASIETAVASMKSGAHEYVVKPIDHEELKRVVRDALNKKSHNAPRT